MDLGIAGKIVVITGAAQGIGKTTAATFGKEGCKLALADINTEKLQQTGQELAAAGYDVLTLAADITDAKAVDHLYATLRQEWGDADFLINNAGITEPAPFEQTELSSWRRVMAVNLDGAFLMSKHAFAGMKQKGGGVIVNLGSFAGKRGTLFGNNASYTVSKAGVIGLTKSLVVEGAPHGIRTLAVCPGIVETDMILAHDAKTRQKLAGLIPLGHLASPQQIADVIVFLCSERASHLTGNALDVNGGLYID